VSPSWWNPAYAAFGGGIVVKLLDQIYAEYSRKREAAHTARQIVDKHLDPILKAADELVGRLRSLAQHDFLEFGNLPRPEDGLQANIELMNFLYLFGQFWARLQIFRREALYVNVAANGPGKRLKAFLETLEIRHVRVVDRPRQRGIGESLIHAQGQSLSCLTYYEFAEQFLSNPGIRDWFRPLKDTVDQIGHTRQKQQVLVYGRCFTP